LPWPQGNEPCILGGKHFLHAIELRQPVIVPWFDVRLRLWSTLAKAPGPSSSALVLVRFSRPLGAWCGLVEVARFVGFDLGVSPRAAGLDWLR